MVLLSSNVSSEGWSDCCLPGQIICRAGTSATLAHFQLRWAYDLQNRSSNHLQVQVSGLGRKSCSVPHAAISAAPPVGEVRVAHPANPGNDYREGGLFRKYSQLFHCSGATQATGGGSTKRSNDGGQCGCNAA